MRDLKKDLTIFIISCGDNPNFADCFFALKQQTCEFKTDFILNYTPMSKAFQEMLNRCKTPYYIQVDDDMILNPDTVEKMYDNFLKIRKDNPEVVMHCYMLKDVHLDKNIFGVKIYHTATFKKYPYNLNHPSCEVEQLDRIKRDNMFIGMYEEVYGLHSPKWTDEGIFNRYYNLAMKYRIYGYHWMGPVLEDKLARLLSEDKHNINFYALEGYKAGKIASIIEEEKDATKHLKEFKELNGK